MGKSTQKTQVKNNAGGSAKFDEVLRFQKDKDTVSIKVAPAHGGLRCACGAQTIVFTPSGDDDDSVAVSIDAQ